MAPRIRIANTLVVLLSLGAGLIFYLRLQNIPPLIQQWGGVSVSAGPVYDGSSRDTTTTTTSGSSSYSSSSSSDSSSSFSSHDIRCHRLRELEQCRRVLGSNGSWVQDWSFAAKYGQYSLPWVFAGGPYVQKTVGRFQPSQDAPYRWETSWKWVDFNSILENNCQIDYTMDANKFCDLMVHQLQVGRIFFYGDSLTRGQFHSLLNKLGSQSVTNFQHRKDETRGYQATLKCDPEIDVTLLYVNEGGGLTTTKPPHVKNITMSKISWHYLTSSEKRVLAVFNLGAHYHDASHYQFDVNVLFRWLDEIQVERKQTFGKETKDLIFFRTTPSGHDHCEPFNPNAFDWKSGTRIRPYSSYFDFASTTTYDWNLFDRYNDYTRKILEQRNLESITTGSEQLPRNTVAAHIRLLPVVNMTLLRRDGHAGGRDCLHYLSPGPVDWWNHLLYTHLHLIAQSESERTANSHCGTD